MGTMNLGDLYKVWEIRALKRKPAEEEATKMLEKIAKQVQPIMRNRKWKVKVLSEFCPTNPSLLGLNVGGGAEVKLRLRKPDRDWDFFAYEQVLDTMLHELCHIVHGPHNAAFYKLWDELRKECDDLIARGVTGTGQGFDLPGRRLGGFSRQLPPSSIRQVALAAAEKRQRLGSLLPSGPKRLGGNSDIMAALSPIQAAAMAAERRMYDDLWCGSPGLSTVDDSGSGLRNLEDNPSGDNPQSSCSVSGKQNYDVIPEDNGCSSQQSSNNVNGNRTLIIDLTKPVSSSTSGMTSCIESLEPCSSVQSAVVDIQELPKWECSICTLLNQLQTLVCEACGAKKPKDTDSKYKVWECRFCTLDNDIKLDNCAACGQWRYSYGAPVSTRAPNVGT